MSGSTGTSNQSSSNRVTIPPFLRPYLVNTANNLTSAQGSLPSIQQLFNNTPLQGTAALNAGQLSDIGGFQNAAFGGNNTATQGGQTGLTNFLAGGGQPGGGFSTNVPGQTESPATAAEINSFNTLQAPLLDSQAALSGLGNSGALLSSLAQGQESALVPFLQSDAQNQLTASSQLGQLGQQEAQTQQTALQGALSANTLPQQNTQDQLNALYQQAQQQYNLAGSVQSGGASIFPALLGSNSTSSGGSAAPKF